MSTPNTPKERIEEVVDDIMHHAESFVADYSNKEWFRARVTSAIYDIHHQLQKAREEERERIEAIFKKHVPPHAMDLEDSVWLKRLLNKVFNHDKNI